MPCSCVCCDRCFEISPHIISVISTITLQYYWYQKSKIKLLLLFLNVLKKIYLIRAFFTLSVCECFTFFFINGICKTLYLKSSLDACFFYQKHSSNLFVFKCLWRIYLFRNKWERKHRVTDTYYINNDRANVIQSIKVSSSSTQCENRRNTNN